MGIKVFGSRGAWLFAVLIVVLALVAFAPGMGGPFFFDDFANLVGNPALRVGFGDPLANWWAAAWSSPAGGLDRPVAMLSFSFDHALWGLESGAWKRTNMAIHALNALLTFLLLRAVMRASGVAERTCVTAAALVSLAWAVHPLQVSTVLYVVQRMEMLGHTFALLAMLAWVHARLRMMSGRPAWLQLLLAAAAIAVGVFAKETAVLAFCHILAMELIVFRFRATSGQASEMMRRVSWLAVAVLAIGIFMLFWRYANAEAYALRDFSVSERILTQLRILPLYIKWILVPIPTSYTFYYDYIQVSTGLFSPVSTLFGGAFLVFLVVAAWFARRGMPLFSLGIAWFLLGHLLTSGPIPLEMVFEHRNYGPTIGVLLAAAALVMHLAQKYPSTKVAGRTLSVGFIALCLFGTVLRSWEWGDIHRLTLNTATRASESARAQYNLGVTMALAADFDANDPMFHLARNSILASTRLPGSHPQAYAMLLEMQARNDLPGDSAWWAKIRESGEDGKVSRDGMDSALSLVSCRLGPGCPLDDRELQDLLAVMLESADGRSPDLVLAYADFALNVMQDVPFAERLHREAVALEPRSPRFRASLAAFLVHVGKFDEAAVELQAADSLDFFEQARPERDLVRRSLAGVQGAKN